MAKKLGPRNTRGLSLICFSSPTAISYFSVKEKTRVRRTNTTVKMKRKIVVNAYGSFWFLLNVLWVEFLPGRPALFFLGWFWLSFLMNSFNGSSLLIASKPTLNCRWNALWNGVYLHWITMNVLVVTQENDICKCVFILPRKCFKCQRSNRCITREQNDVFPHLSAPKRFSVDILRKKISTRRERDEREREGEGERE